MLNGEELEELNRVYERWGLKRGIHVSDENIDFSPMITPPRRFRRSFTSQLNFNISFYNYKNLIPFSFLHWIVLGYLSANFVIFIKMNEKIFFKQEKMDGQPDHLYFGYPATVTGLTSVAIGHNPTSIRLGTRGLGIHRLLRLSTPSRLDLRQVQRAERLRLAPKPQTGPVLKWVGSTCLPYRGVSTSWRRPMASLWRWSRLCGTHPACPELPRLQITRVSGNKLALPDSWIRHLLLCFPLNCIWIDLLYF